MPSHVLRGIAWGLVWRWSLLFASLITSAPPLAIWAIVAILSVGVVASVWRRRDLLGSVWSVLLAVTVINLGFWLGGGLLVPAITLAIVITVGNLWWSIRGPVDAPLARSFQPVAVADPVAYARPTPLQDPVAEPRRRRASRDSGAAGFRLLVAACLVVTVFTVGAFTVASRASAGLSAAISSIGQQLAPLTAGLPPTSTAPAPAASSKPTPSPTPAPSIVPAAPPTGDAQPPSQAVPGVNLPGVCVSLPDHRYEVRLPNGQVIVVTTHRQKGCPDLAALLKSLQDASGNSE
ncbi:MAG: hypothetical protein ABI401_15620 [Candidatus Dormibacter sp.]